MSIQDLGRLGEFVAAIATLVTLVYLALQIKHNTRALDEASIRASLNDASRFRDKLIENADVARLDREGLLNPESLDATERLRFRMLLDELFSSWAYQYETAFGAELHTPFIRATLASPGGKGYWKRARSQFLSDFADHVDSLAQPLSENSEPHTFSKREYDAAAQQTAEPDAD